MKTVVVRIYDSDYSELKAYASKWNCRIRDAIHRLLDIYFDEIVNRMQNYEQFKEFLKDEGYAVEHNLSYELKPLNIVNKGEQDEQ